MTDIRTMPAGREMDALVAEKVMHGALRGHILDEGDWECRACGASYEDAESGGAQCVRRYSTVIAAAWEVREKFDGFVLKQFPANRPEYICELTSYARDEYGAAEGLTAPLAICRAALLAIMERK